MLIVEHIASHLKVPATINESVLLCRADVLFLGVRKYPQDAAEVLPRPHSCTPTRNGVRGWNERNRTHWASSKTGFLDSGNGTAPWSLKVALSDQTPLLPRGLFGLCAHLDSHQSVTLLRENTLQKKKKKRLAPFISFNCSFFANAGRLRRQFYLQLHLSWSNCGCNLSWSRCWWWRQISDYTAHPLPSHHSR